MIRVARGWVAWVGEVSSASANGLASLVQLLEYALVLVFDYVHDRVQVFDSVA